MWQALKSFFYWVLSPLWDFIKWCVSELFDIFCLLVSSILSMISLPVELTGSLFDYSGLPGPVLYILHQIGFATCVTMLLSALTVRVLLNLIPSWLTRV